MSTRSYIPAADAVGHTFNRLTVLRIEYRKGIPYAVCQCSCGGQTSAQVNKVRSGHATSCGCAQREAVIARNTTHGQKGQPTHQSWRGMVERCTNPNHQDYDDYGGRGIAVCDRWRESFAAFLQDMGERPPKMEIDRIDNNRAYEPGNCRWATRKQQNRNSRHNNNVTHDGRTQPVSAWAEELGVSRKVIYGRIRRGEPITG